MWIKFEPNLTLWIDENTRNVTNGFMNDIWVDGVIIPNQEKKPARTNTVSEKLKMEAERRFGPDWKNVHIQGKFTNSPNTERYVATINANRVWSNQGCLMEYANWDEPLIEN